VQEEQQKTLPLVWSAKKLNANTPAQKTSHVTIAAALYYLLCGKGT